MNAQKRDRIEQAKATLYQALKGIPGADEIYNMSISDWIRNIGTEDLDRFEVSDMKEAIGYIFEKGEVPPISEDEYQTITDAFKQFVRDYYSAEGGKRKSKKTRRSKKKGRKGKTHRHTN